LVCHGFVPPVTPQLSEQDNGRCLRMFRANVATTGHISASISIEWLHL
jgi:hypothetical protein